MGVKNLFGEPAWDILLDLYVAEVENKRISVSSVCIGTGGPPTTALRYINALVDLGLVARQSAVSDGRRVFLQLTAKATFLLTNVLEQAH